MSCVYMYDVYDACICVCIYIYIYIYIYDVTSPGAPCRSSGGGVRISMKKCPPAPLILLRSQAIASRTE